MPTPKQIPNPNALLVPQELLIVGAATECGIIDFLHKNSAVTVGDMATALHLDTRAVWTVVEALISLGYVTKSVQASQTEIIQLSPEAKEALFGTGQPNPAGFSFMHYYQLVKKWVQLPQVLATGQPVPRNQDSLYQTAFMHAMRRNTKHSAQNIVDLVSEGISKPFSVLDIGGGPLVHARAFAAIGATVTILDYPNIVNLMQSELHLEEPISLVTGDFNEKLPEGLYDIAYLGNICHIYGADANQKLFKRVANILHNGGRIAITDFVRGLSPRAEVFGVNMLVNTLNGGTWTLEQYQAWLDSAGFTKFRFHTIEEHQLMIAEKAN